MDAMETSSEATNYRDNEFNAAYVACEAIVAMIAVLGNALVIFVFWKERRLRRRTNYYIVSLALADLLVGFLGIPFAILSSIGLPTNLHACLFTVSLLLVLCTISIFCLVAVSVDRYWAILHPMGYSRNVSTKTALVIICVCWFLGSIFGFLPLMGWHNKKESFEKCFFLDVMDYDYLVFVYFSTIITPAILLAAFYAHIYRVVLKQLRQTVTMNAEDGSKSSGGGTMLRMLGAAQKREVKATQNLAIIVGFFMICWIPLYTINCYLAFCNGCQVDMTFMNCCIILSHLNSAGNPLLYAYHLRDFRAAMKNFFCSLVGNTGLQPLQITKHRPSQYSQNYSTHSRILSNRETRSALNLNNSSKFVDSPLHYRSKSKSMFLPPTQRLYTVPALLGGTSNIGIVREMWQIPELPSNSDEKDNTQRIATIQPTSEYDIGKVNSGYSQDSVFNDEDNDIFVDDTIPITEFKTNEIIIPRKCNSATNNTKASVSFSSPHLPHRNVYSDSEENSPRRYMRSYSDVDSAEQLHITLSLSSDISGQAFKLSPYKTIGELLLNTRQVRTLSEGSSASLDADIVKTDNAGVPKDS